MIAAQAPKAHRIRPLTEIFFKGFFFFLMWTIFKVPVYLAVRHVTDPTALDPGPGIEPVVTASEGEVPATGPPRKSPHFPRF